jgi:hypothetical protein
MNRHIFSEPPPDVGRACLAECIKCGTFYVVGSTRHDENESAIFCQKVEDTVNPEPSGQPFTIPQVKNAVIELRSATWMTDISPYIRSVYSRIYNADREPKVISYGEMLKIMRGFVWSVEETIMRNWPEHEKRHPIIARPSSYWPHWGYPEYLENLESGLEEVAVSLNLMMRVARGDTG